MKHPSPPWLLALALSACATPGALPVPGTVGTSSAPELNAELLMSADSLATRLGDSAVVVVHVGRDRSSYDAGHIPGARFLPLGSIVAERDGVPNELPGVAHLDSIFEGLGVSDSSHVVLYGDLGGLAAARAFFTLEYLGHTRVALLDGGIEGWRSGGRPLIAAVPAPARGILSSVPRPEIVASAAWVRERLTDPRVILIDARPPAEYSGAEAGSGVARPGHIPGAHNIFWRTALVSEARPHLRHPAALRALYEAAGAATDKVVVAYCRTGVQASHAYFVSRY
nr:rhodanese-like domain-containing protein [Gemmatimonadota bacterium]